MKKFFKYASLVVVMMFAYCFQSYAQPGAGMRVMPPAQMRGEWQMMMNQRLTADNGVQYTGSVIDKDGQPLVGVHIMAFSPKAGYVYTAKSDKKGNFKMLLYPGMQYVVEFTSLGYKKYAAVCESNETSIQGQPVVMEPSVEGIAQMKGKAPTIIGNFRSIQITLGKHPANAERSLVDLLNELPAFEITPQGFLAFMNSRNEIRINNKLLKVRPQALYGYLSNIAADDFTGLRVTWADVEKQEAAQVYITTKE